jgi:glucosamine--fructose-6-phosphate aminotransferase (isomerizing)
MKYGADVNIFTDGSRQAGEYKLDDCVVFGASNSGQTKEVIWLFNQLLEQKHQSLFALIANTGTKLESLSNEGFVLSCGKENAVAATKSVVEQALFYAMLLSECYGWGYEKELPALADAIEVALTMEIPAELTDALASAPTIYFAGRNDGVAEELTLKTNEITRCKSDYLEGTYAVHGIEEVMTSDDVVILIDPFEAELEKIHETLTQGVGMKVFAISAGKTPFPTIKIDYTGNLAPFVYLCAGWNILVEAGLKLGVDLDHPVRARKVGNEFDG